MLKTFIPGSIPAESSRFGCAVASGAIPPSVQAKLLRVQMQPDLLSLPFHKSIAELEKRLIENALNETKGNKTEAADRLQINRRLLYNKIEEHKIGY